MKERPILFSAPMIRAILDGSKTQTRRIMKPQPTVSESGWFSWNGHAPNSPYGAYASNQINKDSINIFVGSCCPFGKIGDRLWVRETTEIDDKTSEIVSLATYSADGEPVLYSNCGDPEYNGSAAHWWYSRDICPSIHMPRWASRITLEITDIRVEQLQDISDEDALAEGILTKSGLFGETCCYDYRDSEWPTPICFKPRHSFMSLWELINGEESWDSNPWVWVIEFKRV